MSTIGAKLYNERAHTNIIIMDTVYDPKYFGATEPLNLKEYFVKFQAECGTATRSEDALEARLHLLKQEFNLPFNLQDVADLDVLCDIDKLKVQGENKNLPLKKLPKYDIAETHPITENAEKLSAVQTKKTFNTLKNLFILDRKLHEYGLNYDRKLIHSNEADLEPGSCFIYKLAIFAPTCARVQLNKIIYEMEVLNTNTLTEIADAITCISDLCIVKEVENMDVDLTKLENAKEKYPSKCFFIENVFYNDMSHPNAMDYSEVVRKWAVDKGIGVLSSVSMEGVTLESLQFRLGYPYVYIHQGQCEHNINFTDAKLLQYKDCLESKKYPRITYKSRETNYICYICSEVYSTWMILNSDRLPTSTTFLCTNCCKSYMFVDGKKVGRFQLFPCYSSVRAAKELNDDELQTTVDEGII